MARATKQVEREIDDDAEDFVTPELAEKLDKMIRDAANHMQDAADTWQVQWDNLKELLAEAKAGSIHSALGFDSWPAYVVDAVGVNASNIDERRVCVALLVSEGLSTRAIARMLKVSQKTVDRDSHLLGAMAAETAGLDGKTYPRKGKQEPRTPIPPQLRFTKSFNAASEDISRMIDRIDNDAEIACAASEELAAIIEMRDSLSKLVTRLRKSLKTTE